MWRMIFRVAHICAADGYALRSNMRNRSGAEPRKGYHALMLQPARRRIALFGTALALLCAPEAAFAAGKCSFKPRPPVTLKDMGPCNFDAERLSFAGDAAAQARCLLSPVKPVGRLGPPLAVLPAVLAERVGRPAGLPERADLRAWLAERDLDEPFGRSLTRTVAYARDNDKRSRPATYFVIHDTSTPNYGSLPWPRNIDEDAKINNLDRYRCSNNIERAHVFINRAGAVMLAHDFDVPWRATKFEMATNFDGALKGLFLHVELIQPRRRDPRYGRRNDFLAPNPGFTRAQYDALALVYVIASVRAGFWLVPAFHAVIDEGIRDKHDDPQNFELDAFAASLERLLKALGAPVLQEAAK